MRQKKLDEGGDVQGSKRGLIATFILEMARITTLRDGEGRSSARRGAEGPGREGQGGAWQEILPSVL